MRYTHDWKFADESCSPGCQSALDLPSAKFRPKALKTRFHNAARHDLLRHNFVASATRWKALILVRECMRTSRRVTASGRPTRCKNERILLLRCVLCFTRARARARNSLPSRLFALPPQVAFARLSLLFKKIKPQVAATAAAATAGVVQPC
jgi:hypothetical protein